VPRKQQLTHRGAQKRGERERSVGLEPDDDAARWLDEHDPKPKPQPPKSATKSKCSTAGGNASSTARQSPEQR
jgi:hypothetical protein